MGLTSNFKTCAWKDTTVEGQHTDWEKMFANHISDKGLISRIYRDSLQLNRKNQIAWFKSGQRTWMDISPEVIIDGQQMYEKMFHITNHQSNREMEIKTTRQYFLTLIRKILSEKNKYKCWWRWGEIGTLLHCLWDRKMEQFSSVAQLCLTLCDPMNHSTPGLPVHHQLLEFTQTHVHWVSDAIQPSHPLSSPSPLTLNLSQHQGLFKWVSSSPQVAKVLEFQLQPSVLPMNNQDWSPLGWTGWISLQSKGVSRVFSSTTVKKHQFFGAQLSL